MSPEFEKIFIELEKKYSNIKLLKTYEKSELKFSLKNFPEAESCQFPYYRNEVKDTRDYIFLMNSKIDFVKETIDINPFSSNYFCWFDFSLPHVFKQPDNTIEKFKSIAEQKYIEKFLVIPCYCNNKIHDILFIKREIVWRFSGGFFMGDKESLTEFYNISYDSFKEFLLETNTIVWEVNYWAWLESKKT